MDVISPQFNEAQIYKKPGYKKWWFYILFVIFISVGYFTFRLGIIYNTIVVGNSTGLWSDIKNKIFGYEKPLAADPFPMPAPESGRLDVLILGLRGYDKQSIEEAGGLLTDTMLVASLDKTTKKTVLLSIPRDLYVDMLGVKGKINEIYERGLAKNNAVEFSKEFISRLTGIYIDKVMVFDFRAFQQVVDTLGGIDIYLAKPFNESKQFGNDFSLPAGNNHLTGGQALYFARSRFSTSDFDRALRQQQIIEAIKIKAVELGYLSNPLKATDLLAKIKDNIKTDFQIWDIGDALAIGKSFNKEKINNVIMNTDNILYETKTAKKEYILKPKGDNYKIIKQFFTESLNN